MSMMEIQEDMFNCFMQEKKHWVKTSVDKSLQKHLEKIENFCQ